MMAALQPLHHANQIGVPKLGGAHPALQGQILQCCEATHAPQRGLRLRHQRHLRDIQNHANL